MKYYKKYLNSLKFLSKWKKKEYRKNCSRDTSLENWKTFSATVTVSISLAKLDFRFRLFARVKLKT